MPVDTKETFSDILNRASKRALGGGMAGAAAMGVQVCSLMWLRTTMNFQYRHGTTTTEALKHLYNDGGVRRFYRGILPAMFQGPLSRFGDTAANAGVLTLLNSMESTENLPVALKSMAASSAAATWRIFLMPIDTVKTILQVEGANGLSILGGKLKAGGPTVMYHGALAAASATWVGHFPWFFTYNTLNEYIPKADSFAANLGRNALMGFCSSAVSDTCSNSIRVIKTYRQTSGEKISYAKVARTIVDKEGLVGLFGRGLKTRILANGVQGLLFAVLWKQFEAMLTKKKDKDE